MIPPQEQHPTRLLGSKAAVFARLSSTSALFFGLGFGIFSGQGHMPNPPIASQNLRIAFQQHNDVHPIEQLVQIQSRHFVACGLVKQESEPSTHTDTDSEACADPAQPQQIPEHQVRIA